MHTRLVLTLLSLAPLTFAQSTVISPVRAATTGGGGNSYPWGVTSMHYMQVHSDLKGTFRLINQISFRMSPGSSSYTGTRTNDLELVMGDSVGYDEVSPTYSANFIGTPLTVFARKTITFGPQGTQSTPVSPFTGMSIPFDTPYPYIGNNSIAWDARLYSSTLSGTFNSCDAFSSSAAGSTGVVSGTGCVASGRSNTMSITSRVHQNCNHLLALFGVTNGPSNATTVLAFGATNPAQTFPGICGTIYTDFLVSLPIGSTDALGSIASGSAASSLFLKTNPAPGAILHVQAHSLDAGSTWFTPIANSNGAQLTLPNLTPSVVTEVTRLYASGNATALVSSIDYFGMIGYGLATQFHY